MPHRSRADRSHAPNRASRCLLAIGIGGNAVAGLELAFYYDHGLPPPTLAEHGGFGWGPWIAMFLAWGSGPWLARPSHYDATMAAAEAPSPEGGSVEG